MTDARSQDPSRRCQSRGMVVARHRHDPTLYYVMRRRRRTANNIGSASRHEGAGT